MNEFPHSSHFPTRNEGVVTTFLSELTEKHDVVDAVFLVYSGRWLKAALHRMGSDFDTRHAEIGTLSNVSFKK